MKTALLPRRPLAPSAGECHDLWAALLFLANVVFIGYSAVVADARTAGFDQQLTQLLMVFAGLSAFALAIGSMWLAFVVHYSSSIIEFMLYATAIVFALLAVSSLLTGAVFGALLLGLAAGASYWYLQAVQPRIPFASAVLRVAVRSISAHYMSVMAVSAVVGGLGLVWLGTWSVATFKFLSGFSGDDNSYLEWTELFLYLVQYVLNIQILGFPLTLCRSVFIGASSSLRPSCQRPCQGR